MGSLEFEEIKLGGEELITLEGIQKLEKDLDLFFLMKYSNARMKLSNPTIGMTGRIVG